MRGTFRKWASKSLRVENVRKWCPKQHMKTPASPTWSFFLMEVLTPRMNMKIHFLPRSTHIFGKKVSSKSCSSLNFLSISISCSSLGLMVNLKRCVKWTEWVDNIVHSTFKLSKKKDRIHKFQFSFGIRTEI